MKQHYFYFLLILLAVLSCQKETAVIDDPVPEPPQEIYNLVTTSFTFPDFDFHVDSEIDVCQEPFILNLSLAYGGGNGYHYRGGYDFAPSDVEEIENFHLTLHVRGKEELYSSHLNLIDLANICENNPEQCFVNFLIEFEGQRYNIVYFDLPPQMELKDKNAHYKFQFLEDRLSLECLEYQPVAALEFEYDGYMYSLDTQDSIKVDSLRSAFVIMETF